MKKFIERVKHKAKIKVKALKRKVNILGTELGKDISWSTVKRYFRYILKRPKRFASKFRNSDNRFSFMLDFLIHSKFLIVLLIGILMLKTKFFYSSIGLEIRNSYKTELLSFLFILILIIPLLCIKKNKNRFRAVIMYDIVISLLLLADNLYWTYSASMLSVSQILYVKYVEEIGAALPNLFKLSYILYFIDIPILLALKYVLNRLSKNKKTKYVRNKGKRRLIVAFACALMLCIIVPKETGKATKIMQNKMYSKLEQVAIGSIYGYHFLDAYNAINIKETTKYHSYEEMLADYLEFAKYKEDNFEKEGMYGIAKDKNVIIVQLESVQNFVVGREINGKEITPNLNKFLDENIEVSNMILQSYSTTADSEYSVISSLYPLENGQVFSGFFASINNDIYNLYKNAGYSTMYMHGNKGDFWNRQDVYSRLAVDEILFIDSFDDTSEMIGGFLSDELFYRQAVSKLNDKNEPFMAFLVAASSHVPYYLEGIHDKEKKVSIDIGKYEGTQFGAYLESVNYADYAFGILIDELKISGLYDDSVILVFGDHYGLNMFDENLMEFVREVNPNYNIITSRNNYESVLCGLRVPGVQKRKIDNIVSKLDIKPTLLELSGIEDDLSLGFTMFSTKNYAFINNGYIITDKYYYGNGDWYYKSSGKRVRYSDLSNKEMQTLLEYEANVIKELDISSSIVINNLLLK